MSEDSLLFVKKNIEIFGFGTTDEALMTSFVELLENSIDAVLSNQSIHPTSKVIEFRITKKHHDILCFTVIDNGIGMSNESIPVLCGGIFHTSKQNRTDQTVGKFGVGLKAIMIYYNTTLSVSSSLLSETAISSYKVIVNLITNE